VPASRMTTLRSWFEKHRQLLVIYACSRLVLVVVAWLDTLRPDAGGISGEFANWDGYWYVTLTQTGYPRVAPNPQGLFAISYFDPANHFHYAAGFVPLVQTSNLQSTLGFFPLFPMLMWVVEHIVSCGPTFAGVLVALVGGLIATLLVERLTARWWGQERARQAAIFFVVFPGSVVFSMVYSEGVLIPLAVGCLLALEERRWLLAGVLAGFATAVGPDALAIVPACAVAALGEIWRSGWRSRTALTSLTAPLLSVVGVGAFAIFLWRWVGTPFASLRAQHFGWGERTDLFALAHQGQVLWDELRPSSFTWAGLNLNIVAGLVGAIVLIAGVLFLLRPTRRIGLPAFVWTVGVGLLAVTSEYTPPNPRLLITAFPAVVVLAAFLRRRAFVRTIWLTSALCIAMSAATFVGVALRP